MIRRPPRSPLFPSTPLFRSLRVLEPPHDRKPPAPSADNPAGHLELGLQGVPTDVVDARLLIREPSGRVSAEVQRVGVRHDQRSEEHTSELQSRLHLVCRLLL